MIDLVSAIWVTDVGEVRRIIKAGADPNFTFEKLGLPLGHAIGHLTTSPKDPVSQAKKREIIKILLESGADPNAIESNGRTVYQNFHLLVRPTDQETERLLIDHGAK